MPGNIQGNEHTAINKSASTKRIFQERTDSSVKVSPTGLEPRSAGSALKGEHPVRGEKMVG